MLDLLMGDALPWLIGIAGALVGAVGIYFKGASNTKKNAKIDDLEHALDIRENADEARKNSRDDDRSGDDRLREHGKLRK